MVMPSPSATETSLGSRSEIGTIKAGSAKSASPAERQRHIPAAMRAAACSEEKEALGGAVSGQPPSPNRYPFADGLAVRVRAL
jgi:hypothetical protein